MILALALSLAFAAEPAVSPASIDSLKTAMPAKIRTSWKEFLHERHEDDLIKTFEADSAAYQISVTNLEKTLANCHSKKPAQNWIPRFKATFSAEEIRTKQLEIQQAIGDRYHRLRQECVGPAPRMALQNEAKLRVSAKKYLEASKDFLKKYTQDEKVAKPYFDILRTYSTDPGPLAMILAEPPLPSHTTEDRFESYFAQDPAFTQVFDVVQTIHELYPRKTPKN